MRIFKKKNTQQNSEGKEQKKKDSRYLKSSGPRFFSAIATTEFSLC